MYVLFYFIFIFLAPSNASYDSSLRCGDSLQMVTLEQCEGNATIGDVKKLIEEKYRIQVWQQIIVGKKGDRTFISYCFSFTVILQKVANSWDQDNFFAITKSERPESFPSCYK